MSDAVNEAAQILLPLLAVGANTAVQEVSKEAGKEFVRTAGSVIGRIRKYLSRPDPDLPELAMALRRGVDDGLVDPDELGKIVRLYKNEGPGTQFNIEARNVLLNSEFHGPANF